jgi:hypothetical protein
MIQRGFGKSLIGGGAQENLRPTPVTGAAEK